MRDEELGGVFMFLVFFCFSQEFIVLYVFLLAGCLRVAVSLLCVGDES